MRFWHLVIVVIAILIGSTYRKNQKQEMSRKVVVIGGGLAGLCAALEARAAGAAVTIIEKEAKLGGNSAKASSGMNGAPTAPQFALHIEDSVDLFMKDTLTSGGGLCDETLVQTLVQESSASIDWIEQQGVPLRSVSQCGGHSRPRTHRIAQDPNGRTTPVGWGIMSTLQKKAQDENITLMLSSSVAKLVTHQDEVTGVLLQDNQLVEADSVILTSGGYAGKPKDKENMVLKEFAPQVTHLATTNGPWATGDGIKLGQDVGAAVKDMDKVQVHPTGFVDPNDPGADTKFLAPEALRAAGGILMNAKGLRFTNELGRRDVVSNDIFQHCTSGHDPSLAIAYLIMSEEAVNKYDRASISFYEHKGLFHQLAGIEELAKYMALEPSVLSKQFDLYDLEAKNGSDQFGKSVFPSTLNNSMAYWVARVTPSCHYTMGGLMIDDGARVLKEANKDQYTPIKGFFAAGEVTGGVHGRNRLAGNSLLECVVFGRIAGKNAAGRSH
ncbi:hypothetical protein K450DRAFT_238134 [Umbelopsis ramanniana AG]|uniref:Fumarate reductase n=1 Tax=Umbelopsis ramanniana AG TaxID=1314678 RepID=A0AAD5EBE4_UMBRA|nr:uncharacterized protein K450DRAFT_238134 [Umbelopsis ramanniana AG]KAI8580359.1 hypothetical protein K450DRAFT_238134 [Umbelopsis ramanniana AG]